MYNYIYMIPRFPVFKKLTIEDRKEIESFVKDYPPYSDYNFVSLWSYNTKGSIEISLLNGNLIVKFVDYFGIEHFYSFIGNKKVEKTIDTLFSHSKTNNIGQELILIPEINLSSKASIADNFLVKEDHDNFDYILSVNQVSKLTGNKFGPKRNFVNRFIKNYPQAIADVFDINDSKMQKQIIDLFLIWEKKTNKDRSSTDNEFTAIKRLLKSASFFQLISIGVFIKGALIAFSINEITHTDYAIIHFEKANTSYVGVSQYLKQQTAIHLRKLGCVYINYEQDLGIPGLRKAKESWQPIKYLKKFKIYKKN